MTTTAREAFKAPIIVPKPTSRKIVDGRYTDFHSPVLSTVKSGYIQNTALCDGQGWTPLKCLDSDRHRTEYKTRYNQAKPFHKIETPITIGKMNKRYNVYDIE